MRGADLTMEERKKLWLSISDITEAELDAHFAAQNARQAGVPQPGCVFRWIVITDSGGR